MFAREADTQLRNIPGTPGRSTHILLPEFWNSIAFFFGFVSPRWPEYPANPALLRQVIQRTVHRRRTDPGAVCAARLQRAANGMAAPCAAFLPIQTMICVPGVLHASFL